MSRRDVLHVWYPLLGTVGMWIVHLTGSAALTRYTCTAANSTWTLHVLTLVTAVGAAAGALLAWRVFSEHASAQRDLLGFLGIVVSLTNLLLILAEEGMVLAFAHHRCV